MCYGHIFSLKQKEIKKALMDRQTEFLKIGLPFTIQEAQCQPLFISHLLVFFQTWLWINIRQIWHKISSKYGIK